MFYLDHSLTGIGKVLYKKAFGGRSYDNDEKMTTNTVCWIASMTKFMTATSAAICIQKGLIKVDTDAGTVCKELDNIDIVTGYNEDGSPKYTKAKEKVTLRSLCTHSSGMAYELFDPEMQKWAQATKRTVSTVDSTLECITIPLLFEPDSGWRYSVGLDWAGQIVERLTGKDLNSFMKENIWGPLGMKDTTFELSKNPELYKRQMQIGARELPTQPLVKGKGFHPDPAPIAMGGGGSYSTVDDYLKFITAVLQIKTGTVTDGFIPKETADLLFTPQLKGGALASMQYQFALPDFHPGIAPAWPIDIKESNYVCSPLPHHHQEVIDIF